MPPPPMGSPTAAPSAPPPPSLPPTRCMSPSPGNRISRILHRRRGDGPYNADMPERLRDADDAADEDLTATTQGPTMYMNMNQSIFGLIAAAGSRVDFNERFDSPSSDDEDSAHQQHHHHHHQPSSSSKHAPQQPRHPRTLAAQDPSLPQSGDASDRDPKPRSRRRFPDRRLLRSLPALPRLGRHRSAHDDKKDAMPPSPRVSETLVEDSAEQSDMSSSLDDVPADENRLAPVMSRMLEARAEMAARPSFDLERLSSDALSRDPADPAAVDGDHTLLAKKLKEIFEFEHSEAVISEYPCWLLQSVLLQGYMYITSKHICFYAYLPKKAHEVAKSGYLSKSGKRNPKFHRYWFRLKGDVFSYYPDSTNVYFPSGQIDLRYAISASVTDKDRDAVNFSVVTQNRTYKFRADSPPSAKEWVKCLQRVIFRSHNDGDSVKISLPIENVIDIEDTQMLEFADTCKIRVIDNDETYAIDEYFFSFFSDGKEAINVLKIFIDDASHNQKAKGKATAPPRGDDEPPSSSDVVAGPLSSIVVSTPSVRTSLDIDKARGTKIPDTVKATLSPLSPKSTAHQSPRMSTDLSRSSFDALRFGRRSLEASGVFGNVSSPKRSFSASRRSMSRQRQSEKAAAATEKQDSSDSYVQSLDDPTSTSNVMVSSAEEPSASQILHGSDVFHSPTMRRSLSASGAKSVDKDALDVEKETKPLTQYSGRHAATTGNLAEIEGHQRRVMEQQPPTPTLQSITKMGSFPLQRAAAFGDYLNRTSRKMSSLLATESMGYVEKVSGMWKGSRKHYEPPGLRTDGDDDDDGDLVDGKMMNSMERFRAHFALPETERLQATYYGYILRVLPLYGKIYISDRSFCFRSLLPGTRTKLILPLKDVENVDKEKGFRFGYSGLVVVIRGHEELFFEFSQAEARDDCTVTLLRTLDEMRFLRESGLLNLAEKNDIENAKAERDALKEARQDEDANEMMPQFPRRNTAMSDGPTILFDDPKASFLNFKPSKPLNITCLTIGSRGDVQPYIALCKGLIAEGHHVKIATHEEFKDWVVSHGIGFAKVDGDPAELMRLCIENGTFTWAFLKEANSMFRGWLDDLLASSWRACQDSDLLIESPSAMGGIHIAEALGIPYFRAFTMPWTRTRAYPHAFVMPEYKMGGAYNYMTYVMFDNIFWKATAYQVNRWRNGMLNLPNTTLEKLQPNKVPFLYNFSPSVVAPPLDFPDWIRVTGYWFLDEGGIYKPPADLVAFIEKARADKKKLVYVGFGSIIVDDPAKMTQEVIDAVLKADVRCILSKGWSDRLVGKGSAGTTAAAAGATTPTKEPTMPPEIHVITSVPHDWLFSQIDAASHHGGSGTTGASLRAGIPTIIRPFFGDQFFFGSRVEDLGVGIWLKRWGSNSFGRALWEATHNERMIVKARILGEQIRKENGVDVAIQSLYRDLEYAKNLIKRKAGKRGRNEENFYDDDDDTVESWTFVGADEPDPDIVTRRLSEVAEAENTEAKK